MRIYIDTSVVGGVFDEEFAEATQSFFAKVDDGVFILVVSEVLNIELERAPEHVRDYLDIFKAIRLKKSTLPLKPSISPTYTLQKRL